MNPSAPRRPVVYDTAAVLAFLRNDQSADVVAGALRRGPGIVTSLTLAEVLSSVPYEQIHELRQDLNDAFDVEPIIESDAYGAAAWFCMPGVSPRLDLSGNMAEKVAQRLRAGFMPFGYLPAHEAVEPKS